MLSSQTRDEINADAMKKLISHGLTVENILNTDDDTLDKLIGKCGFHNKKVKYIKATSAILQEKYNSDIPDNIEDITSLPGVGPKMGYLLMVFAWNKPIGIGVDVHVHRISNRLKWVHTNTPEETRLALEAWLPKEYWGSKGINNLFVGFGQTICKPVGPKCDECLINKICPSAFDFPKFKSKKKSAKKSPKKIKLMPRIPPIVTIVLNKKAGTRNQKRKKLNRESQNKNLRKWKTQKKKRDQTDLLLLKK